MNPEPRGPVAEPGNSSMDGLSSSGHDPRVAAGLDEYLAELQSGGRPSREEFLARYPEIAHALGGGLDVLEFLHSAAGATVTRDPGTPVGDVLSTETVLGDYQLIREIGRGGMGVVYEARQISLGRRVAVKVLSGAGVLDPRRLQRFRIEAQAVAQLSHAHIVPIFAVGFDRGIHYYAMQYVEGCTLAEVLENHPRRCRGSVDATTLAPGGQAADASSGMPPGDSGPEGPTPDPDESRFRFEPAARSAGITPTPSRDAFRAIARLAIQAAEGLDHAHTMGILHRDIKPSNLLVDTRGHLWITDFGLARFQEDTGPTITGDLVGTLRYMAPELAMGRRMSFDPRSDIYALGATLYELLTFRPVFPGSDRRELLRQIAQDEPVAPRRHDLAIPRDLETIVMKAMAKEPERRYASVRELADDLGRFLADQPIQARPPSGYQHAAKWARRHRAVLMWAAGAALIAVGIASGVASVLLWQEQQRTAKAMDDFGESVKLLSLADDLVMKGMSHMAKEAKSARTPEGWNGAEEFYRQADAFYDRLTKDPSTSPRLQALAFRRLGFTRMVSQHHTATQGSAAANYRRSIALYERLLATKPGDDELRDGLADAHYNLGVSLVDRAPDAHDFPNGIAQSEPSFRTAIAIEVQRALETMDPTMLDHMVRHRLQFAEWLGKQKPAEAQRERRAVLDLFERLTAPVSPGDLSARWAANVYQALAQVMAEHQWTREQEQALRRGLTFVPDHTDLLYSLAHLLAFRKDADDHVLKEAVKLAKKAADVVPVRSEYWRVLARAHFKAREYQLASEAVGKSLKLDSENGQTSGRLLMSMIRYNQGQHDDAKAWYVAALDQQVNHRDNDPDVSAYFGEAKELLKPILVADRPAADPGR